MAIPEEIGATLPPDVQTGIVAEWKAKIRLVLMELAGWSVDHK